VSHFKFSFELDDTGSLVFSSTVLVENMKTEKFLSNRLQTTQLCLKADYLLEH
jgi:hypothetical protein